MQKNNNKRPALELNQQNKKDKSLLMGAVWKMQNFFRKVFYNLIKRKNTIIYLTISVAAGLFIYLAFVFSELFTQNGQENIAQQQQIQITYEFEQTIYNINQQIQEQNKRINDIEDLEIQNRKVIENLDSKIEEAIRTLINERKNTKNQSQNQITQKTQDQIQTNIKDNVANIKDNVANIKDNIVNIENITRKLNQFEKNNQNKQNNQKLQQFDKFYILHNAIKQKFSQGKNFQQILDQYLQYLNSEQKEIKQLLQKYASADNKIQLSKLNQIFEQEITQQKHEEIKSNSFYQWIKDYAAQFIEVRQKDNQKINMEQKIQIKNNLESAILNGNFNLAKNVIRNNQLENVFNQDFVQQINEMAQIQNELEQIYNQKLLEFL